MAEPSITPPRNEDRLRAAEAFLQEAVFRSREKQASAGLLQTSERPGSCGLGDEAAVELDLSEKARSLFDALWPGGLDADGLAFVDEKIGEWVARQDALDRDRNHFMKAFRQKHGFDRTQYSAEEETLWRSGLDAVNGAENEARRAAATALLAR